MTAPRFSYRVTKYCPALRDTRGAYTRAEWTSYKDVGKVFDGRPLTLAEYERVEANYVGAAVAFMREAGVETLWARGVECHDQDPLAPSEGCALPIESAEGLMRAVLREAFWCRFEAPGAHVHFGWDYYMYIGVPTSCANTTRRVAETGLFVEPFDSPYRIA